MCLTIKYNEPNDWFTNSYLYFFQVHEPKEQKEIVSNFKKFICKHLHDPQPEICYKV